MGIPAQIPGIKWDTLGRACYVSFDPDNLTCYEALNLLSFGHSENSMG